MKNPSSTPMRAVAMAVLSHPTFWLPALGALSRLSEPGWWKHWPPLPRPSESMWRLRMLTAYGGDGQSVPRAEDVLSYLDWTRTEKAWRRR